MKKGLEELKNIDSETVAAKTHIVQSVLEDIINKRYSKINPVKAKGFIKILEREFDLDLKEWMREFESSMGSAPIMIQTVEAPPIDLAVQEKKPEVKWLNLGLLLALMLGGVAYFYYSSVISQAAGGKDSNLTAAVDVNANANNTIVLPVDQNSDSVNEANLTVIAEQQSLNAQLDKAVETNVSKSVIPQKEAVAAGDKKFFVETTKKVWIGIKYLDATKDRWKELTVEQKMDFDPKREQLIAFGHSQVKITVGQTIIESKAGGKIRYHYKDGKLKEITEAEYTKIADKAQ